MGDQGHETYDSSFYQESFLASNAAAKVYAGIINEIYSPQSVIDIGCGVGAWLNAFEDCGAKRLVGMDGAWVTESMIENKNISFFNINLDETNKKAFDQKFDLAITVEVAEHIKPQSSAGFVKYLTSLSDVVLFSAAYIAQTGPNHINEQKHSYWAELFKENNYNVYDLFRPKVWGDDQIPFWYRQNCFLYTKIDCAIDQKLKQIGRQPLSNLEFMNCVHPELFNKKIQSVERIKKYIPSPLQSLIRYFM